MTVRAASASRSLLAALAVVTATAACSSRRPDLGDLPTREVTGHLTGGRDANWFRPCVLAPADSAWWVTFTDRAVVQRDTLRRSGRLPDGQSRFVRWLAAVTRGGEVGPRGPGAPALLVRDILEVRVPGPGDC